MNFGLVMLEQPLDYDDLIDHAALQRELKTPICLDESIKTPDDARKALDIGACRIINIKPGRVEDCSTRRRFTISVGSAACPSGAAGCSRRGGGRGTSRWRACPGFTLPNDISASARYWREDLIEPPFVLEPDGTIKVPTRPGLGVHIVKERLERVTQRREEFRA
jgi:O-succinylbenzoate synthase